MILPILTLLLFFFIGFIVSTFTIIPICICLFFALPFTRQLGKHSELLPRHHIYRNYSITIAILFTIWFAIAWLIVHFCSVTAHDGFIFGIGFALLIGMGQTGKNKNNLDDYLENNKKYIKSKENKLCTCRDPLCTKCMLINCTDDLCEVHPLEKKREIRERYRNR